MFAHGLVNLTIRAFVLVGDTYHNTNRAVLVAALRSPSGRSVPASSWQIVGDDCGQHATAA